MILLIYINNEWNNYIYIINEKIIHSEWKTNKLKKKQEKLKIIIESLCSSN